MHDYKKLNVWNDSIELVSEIYKITKDFPSVEKFGLTNQINRCAVSIPSNIAEGSGRNTNGEFIHFLGYACGSCNELETQLIIANKLNYVEEIVLNILTEKLNAIQKMIYKLIKSLK
ncbi:MAG: four helix bundle protein [Ignavibacteriae bacterium]|nr:four helix bundle protein [Ignavibacteriota bacterium]